MKEKNVRLASEIQTDSIVDGEGLRTVLWFQGCKHNCKFCQNPETHDMNGGFEISLDSLLLQIDKLEGQNGVTLSGGDPFFQPHAASLVAEKVHTCGMNVWAFTGFTFEQLIELKKKNRDIESLLNNIDVLIDGKFDETKKSLNCRFRGSTNQRILDVSTSLKNNKAIKYMD